MDFWFWLRGVEVKGYVIGEEVRYVGGQDFPSSDAAIDSSDPGSRAIIQYLWPQEGGEIYRHRSSIIFQGREMDRYQTGNPVVIRVLADKPNKARLPGGFSHYLWATFSFAGGLLAVVLVSSLFFVPDGFFGRDLSKGVSLFRSVNWLAALIILLLLTFGVTMLHRWVAPWLGPKELLAVVTGEIRLLPYLLAAKGEPEPGRFLNEAERSFARIPYLGMAFASSALELAIYHGNDPAARRYLAALADPGTKFPVQSRRVLGYAAERGKVEFVKALIAAGIHPDAGLMEGDEPIRCAAGRNQVAAMELLLAAGARTEYPKRPLMVTALEGRAEDAARYLLERSKMDLLWRDPYTKQTLADLALIQGMAGMAALLQARGVPVTLPRFYAPVVRGDLAALEKELPRSHWISVEYDDATLLHLAVRYGQIELARTLVKMGADLNAKVFAAGSKAYTPLIEAVVAGNREMVQFLAQQPHIQLDRGDLSHIPPLAYAIQRNRWDLAELLVDSGANVNIQMGNSIPMGDNNGNSPLHLAAAAGDLKRVEWLLSKGADPQFKNLKQLTPLEYSRSAEITQMIRSKR
jgi:ankyrin repeat protein